MDGSSAGSSGLVALAIGLATSHSLVCDIDDPCRADYPQDSEKNCVAGLHLNVVDLELANLDRCSKNRSRAVQ